MRLNNQADPKGLAEARAALRRTYGNRQKDIDHEALAKICGAESRAYEVAAALRTGKGMTADIKGIVRAIDAQFEKESAVAVSPFAAFRGARLQAGTFKEGVVITDKNYAAFSTSANYAASFTDLHARGGSVSHAGLTRYVLQVDIQKGQPMIAPQLSTHFSGQGYLKNSEAEVILPRGTKFKVVSVSKEGRATASQPGRTIPIRIVRVEVVK